MKDSLKEKVGKISSLYLAINEGLPEGELREDLVLYLAINEGLPEGELREDLVPLPGHK
jgi:uncharacterized protein (DUF488 family)